MDKKIVKSFFVNACYAVYPGEYTKDQLASIFDENVISIIGTYRKNECRYIDYCKTLVIYNNLDIDISTLNAFKDILIASEDKSFSDSDRECYIDSFVSLFIKTFPNYYTYNELYNIIDINVKSIVFDPTSDNRYLPDKKKIILNHVVFDEITFHEFVHAIRGDLFVVYHGIDEGLTELVSLMYQQEATIDNVDYSKSAYAGEVKIAIKLIGKYPNLLDDYLTRKNIVTTTLNDEIEILELTENLYNLFDENYSYYVKEQIRTSIQDDIDLVLFKKK